MTAAQYRQPNVSEEEFYHWATEQHAARAAKLHAKDGMEGFSIFFHPRPFRDFTPKLDNARGNPWRVRDFDAPVEFLFRDMEALYKETVQADLQALQAERRLLLAARGQKSASVGLRRQSETVKVDSLDEAGKPTFLPFKE
ncbi:hypothetical protein CNMCM6936_001915 [Aspergillus lentulus]|uniref:EthD domain-containing protein n=1 Tax=Aspergillus lentulus TaxID=293939 RepID=A0AAN6BLZ8_ASPLE|nr:hypothetical protein CNMCM6069_002354 [Aspergillus lentulus]KAF4168601.1 hypothetical protein CNMCM6936_001915 [Aspergillus lentulus]KAF4202560.1 hypothetical protein CNMCM8927_000105 [Aspergillus lentulus]GFF79304.1 hypothetical protein IFM62136_10031 [Aspergillus lentulus]GFF93048.1 hypothetical protein IFM60648_09952 [Aspergillus lentulus]